MGARGQEADALDLTARAMVRSSADGGDRSPEGSKNSMRANPPEGASHA
jgi:hypothetical protein